MTADVRAFVVLPEGDPLGVDYVEVTDPEQRGWLVTESIVLAAANRVMEPQRPLGWAPKLSERAGHIILNDGGEDTLVFDKNGGFRFINGSEPKRRRGLFGRERPEEAVLPLLPAVIIDGELTDTGSIVMPRTTKLAPHQIQARNAYNDAADPRYEQLEPAALEQSAAVRAALPDILRRMGDWTAGATLVEGGSWQPLEPRS